MTSCWARVSSNCTRTNPHPWRVRTVMDFRFTPEEEAFRAEVRQFLQQELPDSARDGLSIGIEGAGGDLRSEAFVRDFRKKLAARRWLALPWPEEVGGYGASY